MEIEQPTLFSNIRYSMSMTSAKTLFFAFSAIVVFSSADCKDEPTPPVIEPVQDTTSHNFVVTRIDTIGDWFSTAFCVDILDENNIWVGGEFTTKDSTSNYRNITYNLAKWDGEKWNMIGLKMQGFGGSSDTSLQPIRNIKMFSNSSIVVTSQFSSFARYSEKEWITFSPPEGVWEHFWARSINEIYFAGSYGSATYYNGQTFTKMTTRITNPPIIDIWGDENQVYIIGKPEDINRDGTRYVMLYCNNTTNWEMFNTFPIWDSIPQSPNINLGGLISIFRANSKSKLWVLGGGAVHEITSIKPFAVKKFFTIPNVFYSKYIRGNADNDLFLFASAGEKVWHFNGKSWRIIDAPQDFLLLSATVKNNIIVLVGATPGGIATQGIVVILKRY